MSPCKLYMKGHCKYGTKCRDSHDILPVAETASREVGAFVPKNFERSGRTLPIYCKNATASDMGNVNARPPKLSPRPCKFFPLGTCMWGPRCRNSHDLAGIPAAAIQPASEPPPLSSKSLNPNIEAFVPASVRVAEILSGLDFHVRPPCHFYAKGTCKNGILCNFFHDGDNGSENKNPTSDLSAEPLAKLFHGANVTFKVGAEVSKVKLPSDHLTLQLTDLPSGTRASAVKEILSVFGFEVPTSSIRVKPTKPVGSLATVEFDDPDSAKRIVASITEALDDGGDGTGELGAKVINNAVKFGNRLQLSSVVCSWSRPSLSATLIYYNRASSLLAKAYLQGENGGPPFISDPQYQEATESFNVKVKGLKLGTTERELDIKLPIQATPDLIMIWDPSYDIFDDHAGEIVEKILRRCGRLDFYECRANTESNKMQAKASFTDRDAAIRAEAILNKRVVSELGDSKLYVTRIISTKYNISSNVLNALQSKIGTWEFFDTFPGVTFNTYQAAPPTTPFGTIRISGKEEKTVSQAKACIEKALAGTVIIDGEAALWDPWFRSHEGVTFLKQLCVVHNLYIHIDTGKSTLVLFGGTARSCLIVTEKLVTKIKDLSKDIHRIVLDKGLLARTFRGGMQKIRQRFGEAATFNLSNTPRTITIRGSEADHLLAQSILKQVSDNNITSSEEDDCSICLCPAEIPLVTACGHTYCKNCFYDAASSSTKKIPFSCHGKQGECTHQFSIRELRDLLPFSRLETLLQDSFERYISMHPEELQYCPMLDCHSLYHPTKTGVIVTCNSCLNNICTSCNIVSHHPITCEDWKENHADGGTRAFESWKAENNAKDCPKCKTPLMKSEGCNHIHCDGCKIHLCWKCLETFSTSALCYVHMTATHGGFYDEAVYQDEDTDTETDDE